MPSPSEQVAAAPPPPAAPAGPCAAARRRLGGSVADRSAGAVRALAGHAGGRLWRTEDHPQRVGAVGGRERRPRGRGREGARGCLRRLPGIGAARRGRADRPAGIRHLPRPGAETGRDVGRLEEVGKQEAVNLASEDVSEQYLDLEMRLRTQQQLEERLRGLLDRPANRLTDLLEIEKESPGCAERSIRCRAGSATGTTRSRSRRSRYRCTSRDRWSRRTGRHLGHAHGGPRGLGRQLRAVPSPG